MKTELNNRVIPGICLKPSCDTKMENANLILSLSIPLGASVIFYTFLISPVDIDEVEYLKFQVRDMQDITEGLEKEVLELKTECCGLKNY